MSSEDSHDTEVSEELLDRIEAGEEHPPKPDFMTEDEWERLRMTRNRDIIRMAGTTHADSYRSSSGKGMDTTQGGPVVVLTTKGRKTGNDVVTCVNYMQDGDDLIVVGSFSGFKDDPHWVRNLEKDPHAEVQVYDRAWPVVARRLRGEERAQLWPALVEYFPLWGHFQKYCRREFAVFVLSPESPSGE